MSEPWKEELTCAIACFRCNGKLGPKDPRILLVYDHRAICMTCKAEEEKRPDHEQMSNEVAGFCLIRSEATSGDANGYCYHHFVPFLCS